MKCKNCGFISSKDFYRCPYCGHIHDNNQNVLDKSITFNETLTLRVKTFIDIFLFNLFGLSFIVDWYLSFQYAITLWGYILFIGIFVFTTIFSNKKKFFSFIIGMQFYCLLGLLLAWCYYAMPSFKDAIVFIPTFVIPSFIILSSLLSSFAYFPFKPEKKIRPIWFGFGIFINLVVATIIFVFFLVCKNNLGDVTSPFNFMAFGSTPENQTVLYKVEEILIFASFGFSLFYLVNYWVTMLSYIFNQVKGFYGKQRD